MVIEQRSTGYPSIDKPWLKYYTEEEIKAPLPDSTFYEYVRQQNEDNFSRICLNYYGTDLTYGEFFEKVDTIASAFQTMGIKKGSVVTIAMINSPETTCSLFALNKIGAVANMVYGQSTPKELQKCVLDANSTVVLTLDLFQDKFLKIADSAKLDTVIVSTLSESMSFSNRVGARIIKKIKPLPLPKDSRFISWKAFIKKSNGISETAHDSKAPAVITYTGGTTGGSKGVLLSNKSILAVPAQVILGEKNFYRDDKWVQVLPLFIAFGITCSLMVPMIVGMTLIVRIPMTESIKQIIKKFDPSYIMYGPAYWEAFADEDANLDLTNFIAGISGGDVLHKALEQKINNYLKKCNCRYPIMNGYGMTEVGAAISVNFEDNKYEFGSVGLPFVKNIVSAFDIETGKELTFGQIGEICIHSPSIMDGYINNPEETAKVLYKHEDGLVWLHTGDLGYVTEKGFIHIEGRIKRYMLVFHNGVQKKVFSLDIEKALLENPIVKNCVVVPVSDKVKNQVPVAYIISDEENLTVEDQEKTLRDLCKEELDSVFHPTRYFFVDELPLTKVGKVDYRELERMAEEEVHKKQ